jgi:hypothetical protein
MNGQRSNALDAFLRRGSPRRRLLTGFGGSLAGAFALLGLRATDARPLGLGIDALSTNSDDNLLVPGPTYELELSAKGAGCDIRSWVRGQVGSVGAPLFVNNHAAGATNTIINLHTGLVGIGTASPGAKLHVAGDLRVDGLLIGGTAEIGTHTRGTATLRSGEVVVSLPEHFPLVTEPEGLTVQLTARGKRLQLFVAELTPERLVVREADGQDGDFDFLVQGVRKDAGDYQPTRTKAPLPPVGI